jgi:TonB family protein
MCPFRKAFPFVLFLHLIFAVGIFAGYANNQTSHVFTLLPAMGVGEELREGVKADEIQKTPQVVQSPAPKISPVVTQNENPEETFDEVVTDNAEDLPNNSASAQTQFLPSLGSVAGSISSEKVSAGGDIRTDGIGGKIVPPVAIRKPRPLRSAGIGKGSVVLSFTIDAQGRVAEPNVESASCPPMADAVLAILPKWRFSPAKEDGRAVGLRVRQVVEF